MPETTSELEDDSLPEESEHSESQFLEGLSVGRKPAPLGRRMMALAVDWGVVGSVTYLIFVVMINGFGTGFTAIGVFLKNSKAAGGASIAMMVLFFIAMLAMMAGMHIYFIWQEFKRGTTLGKKMFGLSVISLDGKRLSKGQCIKREIYRYLDCMLMIPGIVSVLMTKKQQRLGDLFSGTMVVYSTQMESKEDYLYVGQEDYNYLSEMLNTTFFDEEDMRNYLEDAYRKFVAKERVEKARLKHWADYFRTHAEIPDDVDIDDRTLLLFYAEHGFSNNQLKGVNMSSAEDTEMMDDAPVSQPKRQIRIVGESSSSNITPGGFWKRFVASIIDSIIMTVVTLPVNIGVGVVVGLMGVGAQNGQVDPNTQATMAVLINLASMGFSMVVTFFYVGWFYKNKGATPGKLLLGLKVIDANDGTHLNYWRAFFRETIGKFVSGIVLGVGFIMAGIRGDKKALHDLMFTTQVIEKN